MPLSEHRLTILRSKSHQSQKRDAENAPPQESSNGRYELASLVSHGIRTPFASILGFREILQDATALPESEREEFHRLIAFEGRRLSRFVLTLRDYMELCDGRLRLDKTVGDLRATVRTAIEGCVEDAKSRDVLFLTKITAESLSAAADHPRLRAAIEQVLSNAIQATPPNGRVVIRLHRSTETAIISVSDTGIGIPSADVAKVTNAFYRVDRRDGGESRLGLGLTLTRALAEMHDGSLDVISREGVGTVVVLRIPLSEVA